MVVRIREAVVDDVESILKVGRSAWRQAYGEIADGDFVTLGLARWWTPESVRPVVEASRSCVAEIDGEIVAVTAVGPLHGDLVLFRFYVLPERQGQGVGRKLMDYVLERARESGHRIIRLSYPEGNTAARRFYAAHGFTESHREQTGEGIPESVWMVRDLWETEPDLPPEPDP